MNTELMIKAQTLLYSHTDKLEALVVALESVCLESNTEVPDTSTHPLINYTVSEKDIGSLVYLWDVVDYGFSDFLADVDKYKVDLNYGNREAWWDNAKPYTDTFKLHFKPWVVTSENKMPTDVASGDLVYVLFSNGEVKGHCNPEDWIWSVNKLINTPIVGYCHIKFVNPILEK